jgi:hypothetical protein
MKLRWSFLQIVLGFAVSLALSASCAAAQDDQDNYFTGTLVENAPDHLKVSRVLQGKPEAHVFKMNAETKVEGGRLRLRQRINVRYISSDDGDVAILVIVRPARAQPKKEK